MVCCCCCSGAGMTSFRGTWLGAYIDLAVDERDKLEREEGAREDVVREDAVRTDNGGAMLGVGIDIR